MYLISIEELLLYAKLHLGLDDLDAIYARNELLRFLQVDDIYEGELNTNLIESLTRPDLLLGHLHAEIAQNNLTYSFSNEVLDAQVMGILSPLPSIVRDDFWSIYLTSPKEATDYFYRLSVLNYYVQKTNIEKNLLWKTDDGIDISINLSKPEKDNKDIQKLVGRIDTSYPKCVLCYENLGFFGKEKFANRKNIRIIPFLLSGEPWFMQYSPYGYFNEHLIVVKNSHEPMSINENNLCALFDFIDMFPHYFIGSNSDLPITGGSILNHEHFQGGDYLMPIMLSKEDFSFRVPKFSDVHFAHLAWYNSAFLLKGKNRNSLLKAGELIRKTWDEYCDESVDIIAKESKLRHNSITPILRKVNDEYLLYIILRNNRTNDEYPDGIFHAHPEYFHIKKEGIGLIEAMGYFILPARLMRQIPLIAEILEKNIHDETYLSLHPDLAPFVAAIHELKKSSVSDKNALMKKHIEDVCRGILKNTAVFKDDERGIAALKRFIVALGGQYE